MEDLLDGDYSNYSQQEVNRITDALTDYTKHILSFLKDTGFSNMEELAESKNSLIDALVSSGEESYDGEVSEEFLGYVAHTLQSAGISGGMEPEELKRVTQGIAKLALYE